MATPFQITVDCGDADRMSAFWSVALGYVVEPPPTGYLSWEDFLRANSLPVPPPGSISAIVDPDGAGPRILFLRAAELPASVSDAAKTRFHLDVRVGRTDTERQAKIDELTGAGAEPVRRVDENGQWWMVMTDPEGNEFCVT